MKTLEKRKKTFKQHLLDKILIIFAIIWILPFLYVIVNAFKSNIDYNNGNFWDLPLKFVFLENIKFIDESAELFRSFFNSLIYGIVAGIIGVFLAALAGYGISTLKIKRGRLWFFLIYCGTIFPFQIYLIPTFRLYLNTGLYDTQIGMILIYIAMIIPFSLFVMRNFFYGISGEMLESARIDGATDFEIFLKIYLPIAMPSLLSVFLFQFTWIWGDLLFGMTLTKSSDARTIMSSIAILKTTRIPATLLAGLIVSSPTLILFIKTIKNLEKGIVFSSK